MNVVGVGIAVTCNYTIMQFTVVNKETTGHDLNL